MIMHRQRQFNKEAAAGEAAAVQQGAIEEAVAV